MPELPEDTKEWVRVTRAALNGATAVTVTLQCGNISVKWSVRAYGDLKKGLAEARAGARTALDEMAKLLAEAT